jgi:hypothetical protein
MSQQYLGTVEDAQPGARGFDTNRVITRELARAFAADGYRFCVRYVSHHEVEPAYDVTRAEVEGILAAGLALMLVQHVRARGWAPTGALGTSDGARAAAHAAEIGCPRGLSLWCDVEGFDSGVQPSEITAYANAWHQAVTAAGFTPGVYVGTFALSGAQLHRRLAFRSYWKSGMKVADVEERGYQMVQSENLAAHGIQIDRDTIQRDHLGGVPRWLVAAPR